MNKNILIVDDDPDILLSIKNIFENKGYNVSTAINGRNCIDEVSKGFKGLILIDIMMPRLDGWDTIREIIDRGFSDNINILVITAIGTKDHNKIHGLEPYINDYIAKPFDLHQLISSVKQILNN